MHCVNGYVPVDLKNNKSSLVEGMAWCHQAPSNFLHQCWTRFKMSYSTTWPRNVNQSQSISHHHQMLSQHSMCPVDWELCTGLMAASTPAQFVSPDGCWQSGDGRKRALHPWQGYHGDHFTEKISLFLEKLLIKYKYLKKIFLRHSYVSTANIMCMGTTHQQSMVCNYSPYTTDGEYHNE